MALSGACQTLASQRLHGYGSMLAGHGLFGAGLQLALLCLISLFILQVGHPKARFCGRGSLWRLGNMDNLMLELLLGTWSHWAVVTNLFGSPFCAPPLILFCGVAYPLVVTRGTNFYPGLPLSASSPSPLLPDTEVFVDSC